jgi:hypothetical protein
MPTPEEQAARLRSEILRLSSIVEAAKITYRVVSLERALIVAHAQTLEELEAERPWRSSACGSPSR